MDIEVSWKWKYDFGSWTRGLMLVGWVGFSFFSFEVKRVQGGCIYDNLNWLACLHLLLISDLLFKYEASASAITTFSVKQRSQ